MTPDEEIIEIFEESGDLFLGTSEVADELGYSVQGTGKRLDEMAAAEKLEKKVVGGTSIYWLSERTTSSE